MGVVEYGAPQILTFDFNSDATSKLFNQINKDINPIGIYTGFSLTRLSSSSASISPGVCYIEDSTNNVGTRVQTSQAQAITVTNSTPFIVLRFVWENTSANYMDMLAVGFGDIQSDDLILGRCVYNDTGTDFSATFDLTRRSTQALRSAITKNSYFCVYPNEPASKKVYITGGILNSPQGNILFSGGVYPAADITDTINGRNDLLYVDFDGTLKVEYGVDSSSPVTPRYGNKKVIAEIRRGASRSNIKGNEIFKIISNFDMMPESSDLTLKDIGNLYSAENVESALQEIAGSSFTLKGEKTFDEAVIMKSGLSVTGAPSTAIQTLKKNDGSTVQYVDQNGKLVNTVGTDLKITDPNSVFATDKVDEALNQLGSGPMTIKGYKTFESSPYVPNLLPGDSSTKVPNSAFVLSEKVPLEALKTYSPSYIYALNEATFYNGVPYKSLQASNINNTPESSPTFWEVTGGGTSTGGGEVGYTIPNGQFESNVVGWEVYADAASPTPADGTGGIAASTFTRTDTDPLLGEWSAVLSKSTNNRQGEGISTTITIDAGKTNTPAQIKFVYKTSPNYVSGDIRLFIYDIDNSVLVPCNNVNVNSSYGVPNVHIANFFPNLNSTSYRLILHIATGNINDYTFTVDDITVGSKETIVAPAISDWQAYTPTFQGFGTPTAVDFKWRRNGSNIDIKGKFTAGTVTASEAQIGLPTPYATRSDVPTLETVGWWVTNVVAPDTYNVLNEASKTYVTIAKGSAGANAFTKAGGNSVATGGLFSCSFSVPCAQFSVNTSFNGMNEPMYLANSESVINTNGVSAKTISGMDGTPIVSHTAGTYCDLQLPRALQPNESIVIEARSKIDGNWINVDIAGIPSLGVRIQATPTYSQTLGTLSGFHAGFTLAKITSGILRIYTSAGVQGLSFAGSVAGVDRSWASVIAAADGFDRWRVRIGQAGLSEVKPNQNESYSITSVLYSTTVPIKATTKDYGAFSNYNTITGQYIVPFNGVLRINALLLASTTHSPHVWINGVDIRAIGTVTATQMGSIACSFPVNRNDVVEVRSTASYTITGVSVQFEMIHE